MSLVHYLDVLFGAGIWQNATVDVTQAGKYNIVAGATATYNSATGAVDLTFTAADGGASLGVADLAALRAIGPSSRADKQSRNVKSDGNGNPAAYFFDTGFGAGVADDGVNLIKPTDLSVGSAGRWRRNPQITTGATPDTYVGRDANGIIQSIKSAIGAALIVGEQLRNSSAAGAGAQQYSPAFEFSGSGWSTGASAARALDWSVQQRATQGAEPTNELHFLAQAAGGGWVDGPRYEYSVAGGSGLKWGAAAGAVAIGQDPATSGAGAAWSLRGQKGFTGSVGGALTIGGGDGGTPGTNLAGDTNVELGQTVTSNSAAFNLKAAGSTFGRLSSNGSLLIESVAQALTLSSAGQLTIQSPAGLTQIEATGDLYLSSLQASPKFHFRGSGDNEVRTETLPHTGACTVTYAIGVTSVTCSQADQTAGSTNGAQHTYRAQNATGATSTGGKATLQGGGGTTAGGAAELTGGSGITNGNGGNATISGGVKAGSGVDGNVDLKTGSTSRLLVQPTLVQVLASQFQQVKAGPTNSTSNYTFDCTLGNIHEVTMVGNITALNFGTPKTGAVYVFVFIQDGTGSRTLSVPTNLKVAGGAFTLTTTAGKYDMLTCYYDGTNMRETCRAMNVSA